MKTGLYKIILTIFLIIFEFLVFYPGLLHPDTAYQYTQAMRGEISSHLPPILTILWKILFIFSKKPSTMLLLQLALLWGSVYNFSKAFEDKHHRFSYFFFLLPFIPIILAYSFYLVKDVLFASSFLFLFSAFIKISIRKENLNIPYFLFLIVILLLAVGSKFIGFYLLIIPSIWLAKIIKEQSNFIYSRFILLNSFIIFVFIFIALNLLNSLVVNNKNEDNSWQYIKLFDLAGISVNTGEIIFPSYVKNSDIFNEEKMKKVYLKWGNLAADRLVFQSHKDDYTLIRTNDKNYLRKLKICWLKAVVNHPLAYFQHRYFMWKTLITRSHTWQLIKEFGFYYPHLDKYYPIKKNEVNLFLRKYIMQFVNYSVCIIWIPFMLIYFLFGLMDYKKYKDNTSFSLMMLNFTALFLLFIVFFCSMASEARYIYLSLLMVHFSHPIFLMKIKDKFIYIK